MMMAKYVLPLPCSTGLSCAGKIAAIALNNHTGLNGLIERTAGEPGTDGGE